MLPNAEVRPDIGPLLGLASEKSSSIQQTILFQVEEDAIFQGLVHATGLSFPAYQVKIVKQLAPGTQNVALVLLRAEQCDDLIKTLVDLRTSMPNIAVGILVNDPKAISELLHAVMAQDLAQGILPLNLPLRVWLATIWLLLNGGHYLPPDLWAQRQILSLDEAAMRRKVGERAHGVSALVRTEGPEGPEGLTHRELEVLGYVSKGYQNKIIAARMELSEHTVKVHVHNIIRKLRVNNRTQAAGYFQRGNRGNDE